MSRIDLRLANNIICDVLLASTRELVKKHFPAIRFRDAWVYKYGPQSWEFHYGNFYRCFRAYNANEAKSRGWLLWLASQGIEI